MSAVPTTFWDDLAEDLKDPVFLRAYIAESYRIETIDRLVNTLDEARAASGLTKADLARAINLDPAVVRRLLSAGHRNPTIGTLAEVATALGFRLTLEPLPEAEKTEVIEPLRTGRAKNGSKLARFLGIKRNGEKSMVAGSC
ncbi:helix-turn-helix domain-containing transcriptional regulator [Lentzea sp. NPDC055074]